MKRMQRLMVALALTSGLAHAQDLPDYACNPVLAGRGDALEPDVEVRIVASRALPTAEAVVELETMAGRAPRRSYLAGVLAFELAWRHLNAGNGEGAAE